MTTANITAAGDIRPIDKKTFVWDQVLTKSDGKTPEVGARIELIIDGKLYSTVTDADGKWRIDPGTFAEGMHSVQLLAIDKAGNRSGVGQFILDVDSNAPTKPAILRMFDNEGAEKGVFNPGQSSDDKTPVMSGVAEPGTIVTLYDGAAILGSVKADANGNWSIESPELKDGSHSLRVVAKDAFNRESVASDTVTVEVANGAVTLTSELSEVVAQVAPVPGTDPNPGTPVNYQASTTYTYHGTGSTPGEKIELLLNGVRYTTKADAKGEYDFSIPNLAEGTYAIQLRSVDKAGNWSKGASNKIVVVDLATPEKPEIIAVVDDNDSKERYLNSEDYTNDTSPVLRGSAQPGSQVNIKIDGSVVGSVIAAKDGSWSYTLALVGDDKYNISVNYIDRHGKTSADSDSFNLRLDNAKLNLPSFDSIVDDLSGTAVDIVDGQATADKTPTLSGTADANVLVRIWDGNTIIASVRANSQGKWQLDLNLADGTYNIKVDAIGNGGNSSGFASKNFNLIIDTTTIAPAPIEHIYNDDVTGQPVEVVNGGRTNDTTPLLTGTGKAGNIVSIFVKGTTAAVGSVTIGADGKWSYQLTKLADGTYEYTTKVKDAASGRESAISPPYSVIIDTVAPTTPGQPEVVDGSGTITGPLQPGDKTDDKRPIIGGGNAEEGDIVKIIDKDENGNETIIGTAIVDENGKWTFQPEIGDELGEGEHNIIIVITDPAGNESGKSTPIQIIIDTKTPGDLSNIELFDDAGSVHGPIAAGGKTDDATPTISGKGDAGSFVNIYVDGALEASVRVDANGKWTYDLKALTEAAHKVQVEAVSEAGVVGNKSAEIDFTVDVTPPALGSARFFGVYYDFLDGNPLDDFYQLPKGNDLGDLTPQFQGIGTAGSVIVVYGSAGTSLPLGSAVVDANGDWVIDSITLNDETDYAFHAVVRDDAGNETALAATYNVHTDTTPPVIPGSNSVNAVFELPEQLKTMSLNDILAHSDEALFIDNGKTQLIVNEKDGKELTLEDVLPKGEDASSWQQAAGTVTVAGVQYNVYENTTGEAQLLVEQHQQH